MTPFDLFQGLADLAAASEVASAAQEEQSVTQIIVQHVDQDGNPAEDQGQHIELTSLPAGRVVCLPGEVVNLPPGVVQIQPGGVMTTTAEDGSNITLIQVSCYGVVTPSESDVFFTICSNDYRTLLKSDLSFFRLLWQVNWKY